MQNSILFTALLILATGCSPEIVSVVEDKTTRPIESFARLSNFTIVQSTGIVTPKNVHGLVGFKPGEISILIESGYHEAGTIWAKYNTGSLESRLQVLKGEHSRYIERNEKFRQAEIDIKTAKLKGLIETNSELLKLSEVAHSESEQTKALMVEQFGELPSPAILRAEIHHHKKSLDELIEHGRSREEQARLQDFENKIADLEQQIEDLSLKLPFSGFVDLKPNTHIGRPFQVLGNESFGSLVDRDAIYLALSSQNLQHIDGTIEQFILSLAGSNGQTASFSHSTLEEVSGKPSMVYYFDITQLDDYSRQIGRSIAAKLMMPFPNDVYEISKGYLVKNGEGDNWKERLQSLYPELTFEYEGAYSIAASR
jgi:hypothetical protein